MLEIGCGYGDDTVTLTNAGLSVVGFDLSRKAVETTKRRVPSASITCRDIRDPLPVEAAEVGVALASLSPHYFSWDETLIIVDRVRLALRPGGVLLCRLNSTEDRNLGADSYEEIEPGYLLVDGQPKRFFDETTVHRLFDDGWNMVSLQHMTTEKIPATVPTRSDVNPFSDASPLPPPASQVRSYMHG
ncbi:MAG: class I SAM-dependent methyltransferase [Paraburkholderia sp.]